MLQLCNNYLIKPPDTCLENPSPQHNCNISEQKNRWKNEKKKAGVKSCNAEKITLKTNELKPKDGVPILQGYFKYT